jgi:hypothetical protein
LHHAFAEFGQHLRTERAKRFLIFYGHDGGNKLQAVTGCGFGGEVVGEAGEGFLLEGFELLLDFLLVGEEGFEFFGNVGGAGAEVGVDGGEGGFARGDEVDGGLAGYGFAAAG